MSFQQQPNQFGLYDSFPQQSQMDRIDQHFHNSKNRNLHYKLLMQQQNGGKLFNIPKANNISPNYISHNNFIKPLGGSGAALGLDGPQKLSTSTAATAGSNSEPNQDALKPGFLFGSYQGFGAQTNANTNESQGKMLVGELILRQNSVAEQNEYMIGDDQKAVDQRALQELPRDMNNRQPFTNQYSCQETWKQKKSSTSRLQSGKQYRMNRQSQIVEGACYAQNVQEFGASLSLKVNKNSKENCGVEKPQSFQKQHTAQQNGYKQLQQSNNYSNEAGAYSLRKCHQNQNQEEVKENRVHYKTSGRSLSKNRANNNQRSHGKSNQKVSIKGVNIQPVDSIDQLGAGSSMRPYFYGNDIESSSPGGKKASPEKVFHTPSNGNELEAYNVKNHPTLNMPRETTTDIERQNINIRHDLQKDIEKYLRDVEEQSDISDFLVRHEITGPLRARMVDWMVEVFTNFKCDDQTFFLATSLMDRYFKGCKNPKEVKDLHITGVTTMFVSSKYEDIFPLKMKTVHEKIVHERISIQSIKDLEMDILQTINYKIHTPTALDFLKGFLVDVLGIEILSTQETQKKEEFALKTNQITQGKAVRMADGELPAPPTAADLLKVQNYLIEKMAIYLAKMSMHDADLCTRKPSLLAVGAIYVALKICEQLKRKELISPNLVSQLIKVSKRAEEEILEVSQKILYLAQNFDKEFPGLENLKKTHFCIITQLL